MTITATAITFDEGLGLYIATVFYGDRFSRGIGDSEAEALAHATANAEAYQAARDAGMEETLPLGLGLAG